MVAVGADCGGGEVGENGGGRVGEESKNCQGGLGVSKEVLEGHDSTQERKGGVLIASQLTRGEGEIRASRVLNIAEELGDAVRRVGCRLEAKRALFDLVVGDHEPHSLFECQQDQLQ